MILFTLLLSFAAALPAEQPNLDIVGGSYAVKGEFPYAAALTTKFAGNVSLVCGSSILSKSWILTAAHCVTYEDIFEVVVNAGIIDLYDEQAQARNIVNYRIHPNYEKNTAHGYDLVVVKVDPPFEFGEFVQPANMPEADSDPIDWRYLTIVGWGQVDDRTSGHLLKKVRVPLVDYDECMQTLEKENEPDAYKYNNTEVCTLSPGNGPCFGDGGGPLSQNSVLIGVVSWGTHLCAQNESIALYPKVSSFISWIQDNIDEELTFA
ncbi:unnamed protein product [Diabrotica balteata]|uniref:Peptidase S1 domain-containing protein n=1 Tax=Diabrotica balteata TaxID=107213 RepID=A0A9N9SRM1_DIABA|nr:unnamed protein product [Diabrotica balteata]